MQIKLYNDIAFKWIFGRQEHTGPLIQFINSVISHEDGSSEFSEVQILNPFDSSEPFKNEKQGILDIRAKDIHTNQWVNIEVQVLYSESYPQRSKYYLAGLYRDQLEKSKDANYDDLTPIYGIHVLLENLFRKKADKPFWFNHYTLLNTRSHKPLVGHWHLYFVELKKCLVQLSKTDARAPQTPLEQWSYFLGIPRDNTEPIDPELKNNEGIREVYDMLQTFTEDDRLREKYRLQEEFIRAQRTEQAKYARITEKYKAALKAEKAALKAEKSALQKIDKFKHDTIQKMKEQGDSKEKIASLLDIPLTEVEHFFH